ncbi:MAG: CHAD domain-containing protein [Verrucomicrobiales bacterium]
MRRPPPTRLQSALRRWRRLLDRPATDEKRVHDARVVLKEARALLRLFRSAMSESRSLALDQRFRQVMKALAPARDQLIIRQVLADQLGRIDAPFDRDTLLAALPPVTRPKPAALRRVGPALDEFERHLSPVVRACAWETIDQAFHDACRRVRRLQRQARHDASPALWHRWRRRVKALAYQADFVSPANHPEWKEWREQAWHLQAKLGELQDLHITLDCLQKLHLPPQSLAPLRSRLQVAAKKARRAAWRARLRME